MTRSCPLVLPLPFASTFRAVASLDVRSMLIVKQLADGYKSIDRVMVATNEGFFLCNPATGEIARYVSWEVVSEAHWYPSLQVAALVCTDQMDVVVSARDTQQAQGASTTSPDTLAGPTSPPLSPRSAPPTNASMVQPQTPSSSDPSNRSTNNSGSLRTLATKAFQRVRGSTINLGRRETPPLSSTTVSVFPQDMESSQRGLDMSTRSSNGLATSADQQPSSPPLLHDADRVLLHGGQLPIMSPPAALAEFVVWASALSHSRAYHGVVTRSFSVITNRTEHLNAWQAYRVRRPEGLSIDMPTSNKAFEVLSATDIDLATAKERRGVDDSRSIGELRRAALMLGGLGVLEHMMSSSQDADNQLVMSPKIRFRDGGDVQPDMVGFDQPPLLRATTSVTSDDITPSATLSQSDALPTRRRGHTMFNSNQFCPPLCPGGNSTSTRGLLPHNDVSRGGHRSPFSAPTGDSVNALQMALAAANAAAIDAEAADVEEDEFVVVDNESEKGWAVSPPTTLSPSEQCVWWQEHCTALRRENKELRQNADELRVRLTLTQHAQQNGTMMFASNGSGLTTSVGDPSLTLSAMRRHRFPF